jgi:replication-associated recombination protein RarA
MSQTSQDPWVHVRTLHDFPADEVISALQKEIRRGHAENAALLAYEMYATSAELENYLWKRLLVISVEDIGFGNTQAPVLINNLYQMHNVYGRGEGDRLLFAIQAVRFLCACTKDRSTDEMINWIKFEVDQGSLRPQIPEYAVDMHTARGQGMGRGPRHFWEEGARLDPEMPDRNRVYREQMMKILETLDPIEK